MTSAEEAVARAKAIAARLAGTAASAALEPETNEATTTSAAASNETINVNAVADAALAAAFGHASEASSSAGKRKRWGEESIGLASDGGLSTSDDALAQALNAKRLNTGTSTKKIMIPVEKYPGYNFIGLLIGPGGSKQRELVAQAGGNIKISIRGKGSSTSNANPHLPEEPLHVFLEGDAENIDKAEALIMPLLSDPEKAQAEKDKQLAVVGSTKEGVSTYKPKPVAELLGLIGSGGHYGPGAGDEVIEEKIGIPNGFVGYIIGKGGESIANMQRKSGCRVQIQKEHEMEPGTTQRIITLTGATPEAVRICRGIIEEMVQERARLNGHRTPGFGGSSQNPVANAAGQAAHLQKALSEGQVHITVQVPNSDVGLIIGKGGSTIKSIQERSSANVQIPQTPDYDNPLVRTINITHPNKQGAEFAKTLIEEVLAAKQGQGVGAGFMGGAAGGVTLQIHIPDQDVGMCIGKSGCVIREMQQRTQTKIQIPSQPVPGQIYRVATVTGSPEGCQKVQEIIARISAEQSSQFVMTGEAFNQYGQQMYGQYGYGQYAQQQQQQQQPYGSQQSVDYSAQWAAYYAAQSALQTNGASAPSTAATSGPAPAAAATAAAATSGQQVAADQYYEDFFRYAYYYGEDAARQQYGAWAPPEGTPNPYGVNPNLATTTASTAASSPGRVASSSATTAAATTEVKDSSVRRGVSNLPAWMTRNE